MKVKSARILIILLVVFTSALPASIVVIDHYSSLAHRLKNKDTVMRLKHAIGAVAFYFAIASGTASKVGAETALAADAGPVQPTTIGINLGGLPSYLKQRAFANLAVGGSWALVKPNSRWADLPATYKTADGGIASLPPGAQAARMLTVPNTSPKGVTVRCSWTGSGAITAHGAATEVASGGNSLTFSWFNDWSVGRNPSVWIQLTSVNPKNPVGNIDCRETTMPAKALFDPAFAQMLHGYKVLRFMDWQRTNANEPVTRQTRNSLTTIDLVEGDGVPVEDMMVLANEVGASPWFSMPWNADTDYIQQFAQYVHDHLSVGRYVYVENGNEIWNTGFSAARQAAAEGLHEGLAPNAGLAGLYRYGEKTVQVMKIWEKVFADRPHSLIRVAATQQAVPMRADTLLSYRDTAAHVDALATAPYFGWDIMHEGVTDNLSELFRRLNDRADKAIALASQNKAVARKYGKYYVAYEAGQGVVIPYNIPLLQTLERDPRMYDVYKRYLSAWRHHIGGLITLFCTVGGAKTSGSWGLVEHSGQSPADAPKLRAVLEELDQESAIQDRRTH